MKQKTFHILLLAGVITLTASMFAGCMEEVAPATVKSEPIIINYVDTVVNGDLIPEAKTRAQSDSSRPAGSVLTSKSGKKLYLSCSETEWPTDKTAKTRGTKVTTAGISSLGVSASVYPAANSYTSAGCGSYFYKESVSPGTPMSYYWPTSDYKISFFGYYPYNNAVFTVQSAASATGAPTYAYTVPSAIASQQDIMTGQVTDQPGGSSTPVNMTLAHRCSAIHFSVTNDRSESITVNSISIEGVKYSGTLYENTWTLGGSVNSGSSNPFMLSSNASVAADATVDITGTSNVFLMLPQTLPATASLKVVVDDEEFETELAGTWQAGKEYTYSVTINDNAIDLSMVDNAGNARASMTTANCYLVHAAGKYKLPLVYGNAIKNGEENTVAFYPGKDGSITNGTDRFVDHNGDGITGPWITKNGSGVDAGMGLTATSAELLWQDRSGLITSVSVNGDYLEFTVGSFGGGNALIAVKNGSTILWSWHIWATTETLASTTAVNTGSHTYHVTAVNLGWVPTGGEGKQGYCPYYQWGRKDPFIPCNGTTSGNTNKTIYNISGANITPASITESSTGIQKESSTSATIATNIQNPIKNYYNGSNYGPCNTAYNNMWDAQNSTTDNVATATKKTIYDPCPPGFCVPTGNLWYYFGDGDRRRMSTFDTTNIGATWNTGITGDALWFPATGSRNGSSGSLGDVGSGGYYWSATPNSTSYGRFLYVYSSYWRWHRAGRANGFPVRPVAEE